LGDNAQGKTNILEAIYLMATLRSFRGVGSGQMVRHGARGYFVGDQVVGRGEHEIKMFWSAAERKLALDGQPVKKLSDYFGAARVKLGDDRIRLSRELIPKVSPLARLAYRRISNDAEELRIEYQPSVKNDFAVELAQSRGRERTYRSTLVGPHRDELQLLLDD